MSDRETVRRLVVMVGLALAGCFVAAELVAQPPAATRSKTAAPAPAPSASADDAARAKIFASARWKTVETEYAKWLSSQAIYTPAQVQRMGEKMSREMGTMPPQELEGFLDDWDAKLKVLLGKDFQDAQDWLGLYMTNMADGYRRGFLQKMGLTDISNLSAAQLEDKIDEIRAEQVSIKQGQAAFDRSRQETLNLSKQEIAASQKAQSQNTALRNTDTATPLYQSPYRPPPKDTGPPRIQFYMGSDGQIGYALPL